MIKIAPSILSADFAQLGQEIQRVRSADWLHVDVMDGMFVSNISIGVPVVKSLRKATDMFLDVHLMIEKPVRYIDAFARAGADLLSVHLESDMPPGIRAALRARFPRAKNTAQTRGAIRSQVILELERKLAAEIIAGYGEVTVQALEDRPTVCLVTFSFTVALGLNQIWLSAQIAV